MSEISNDLSKFNNPHTKWDCSVCRNGKYVLGHYAVEVSKKGCIDKCDTCENCKLYICTDCWENKHNFGVVVYFKEVAFVENGTLYLRCQNAKSSK